MSGKRGAQPSGNEGGQAASSRDAADGGPSRKRQTRGLSVGGGAVFFESGLCGLEDSVSILAPVTMCWSMRCDPSALAGRKAALEAALEAAVRSVVTEFGGLECRMEWTRVGPSEDTLQQVLPLVLERLGPEGASLCFQVCKSPTSLPPHFNAAMPLMPRSARPADVVWYLGKLTRENRG
jgi:hypothetical protein